MNSPDFLNILFCKPFKFWCCSNKDHKRVTWNEVGDQATCDECGEKSLVIGEPE